MKGIMALLLPWDLFDLSATFWPLPSNYRDIKTSLSFKLYQNYIIWVLGCSFTKTLNPKLLLWAQVVWIKFYSEWHKWSRVWVFVKRLDISSSRGGRKSDESYNEAKYTIWYTHLFRYYNAFKRSQYLYHLYFSIPRTAVQWNGADLWTLRSNIHFVMAS